MVATSTTVKNTTACKTVHVIARYTVNATGTVIYDILNGGEKEYIVTLSSTGATCTCEGCAKWHKVCFHQKDVLSIEALRGAYLCEHGTLAGFVFALPQEKKEERVEVVVEAAQQEKVRTRKASKIEVPTNEIEMRALRWAQDAARSEKKRNAIAAVFASMADVDGNITLADGARWHYDADLKSVFEIDEEFSEAVEGKWVAEELASAPRTCPSAAPAEMSPELPTDVLEDMSLKCPDDVTIEEQVARYEETLPRTLEALRSLANDLYPNIAPYCPGKVGYVWFLTMRRRVELEAMEVETSTCAHVEPYHDKNLCSTCYRIDGEKVLISPVSGELWCSCTKTWCEVEKPMCEHIALVVSDPARMETRRQEMALAREECIA